MKIMIACTALILFIKDINPMTLLDLTNDPYKAKALHKILFHELRRKTRYTYCIILSPQCHVEHLMVLIMEQLTVLVVFMKTLVPSHVMMVMS